MTKSNGLQNQLVADVSRIVSEMAGIQLGDKQAAMVESRLSSRMARLKITDPETYLKHLRSNLESESQALLSLLTTHHTYFFREFSHFEFLLNVSLPRFVESARQRGDKTIRIWSAACSTGQEAYSLAMFFQFHLSAMAPDVKFEILGTDVDPKSVATAANGVYKDVELKSAPAMYVKNQWISGTQSAAGFLKANKKLKAFCKFQTANLFSLNTLGNLPKFDLIFCRNVFIYFNEVQIKEIAHNLFEKLNDDGNLILGVSETLMGLKIPSTLVGPSVYSKSTSKKPDPLENKHFVAQKILKVLCIDDSPSIHSLLKKVLNSENNFEVAATAMNGREALKLLETQRFDAITLDLHMPEVDGITFLELYKNRNIPILIVSSVNRDEPSLGKRALQLGAIDYVEKPSLENLSMAGNEIRSKIRLALSLSGNLNENKVEVTAASHLCLSTDRNKTSLKRKIRVLIVDDSFTIRDLLAKTLSRDQEFEVVGQADRPSVALELLKSLTPDVMTLDIHMPEMSGVDFLKKVDRSILPPTVMISSISEEEGPFVLEALENGAVDYIKKPNLSELKEMDALLRERLKIAASSKKHLKPKSRFKALGQFSRDASSENRLIVIGSSTGGTEALRDVLEGLPDQIPPILIVQHIPAVFSNAFANRLNQLCRFEVKEAHDGDEVKNNRVLIAPGGRQMKIVKRGDKHLIQVTDDPVVNRHKPSVDYLFESVSKLKHVNITAVILTGMGADGARQMKELRSLGARTIAQDECTSVVFGMPRAAIELNAAEFVLPLNEIASKIVELCNQKSVKKVS